MDYKESLLLPKTEFPMRGNLPNNEPVKYKQWDEKKVYEKMKRPPSTGFFSHPGIPNPCGFHLVSLHKNRSQTIRGEHGNLPFQHQKQE